MSPRLPFSVAEQTIHVQLEEDNEDGPALDIFFDVFDADTSKARMFILGKDGADDVVLHFARGGGLERTEYRKQPEDTGDLNEKRNARDVERIKAAKEQVSKFEEDRLNPDLSAEERAQREPDEHTKTLAAMDLPAEAPEHPEDKTRTVELQPNEMVRRSPKAFPADAPAHPDEGRPEDDPRRPGNTPPDRPTGMEPKDGDVVTTTSGPRTIPR